MYAFRQIPQGQPPDQAAHPGQRSRRRRPRAGQRQTAKASYAVKVGDTIEITFGNRPVTVRVLAVEEPKGKDVARELFEVVSQPS